jgi:hypothetical protein
MVRTIVVVSWVGWTSYKDYFRAAPHDAASERCAAPHDAACERCAALHAASGGHCAALHGVARDQRAALGAVSYRMLPDRTLLERMVLEWMALEWMALERMAVPEPQHLMSIASWPARQNPTRRLVREG